MTPEEVKITNTLLIVVACFMVCWASFAITMFIDVYYSYPLPRAMDISTLLLGYANSMCNPVVYGIRNQTFKRELIRQFRVCFSTCSVNRTIPVIDDCQVSHSRGVAKQTPERHENFKMFSKSSSIETKTSSLLKLDFRDTERGSVCSRDLISSIQTG